MDYPPIALTDPHDAPPSRPPPRLNVISMTVPILGVVTGLIVFFILYDQFNWWPGRAVDAGIHTLAWFIVVGFLASVVAAIRREKWWGMTAFGMIANGGLMVVYWVKSYSIWPGVWPEP